MQLQSSSVSGEGAPLRRGHWRALELLEDTRGVLDTLARFEHALGHPVYLRPTDRGLTVISLDPATPAMVGVGPHGGSCSLTDLVPSEAHVAAAVAGYRAKVAAMTKRSREERYVISRIRSALTNRLEVADQLLFLHQEWRFSSSRKIDVLAVDQQAGQLVVIEVKRSEALALAATTIEQAEAYVTQLITASSDYLSYFQRLLTALARVYRPEHETRLVSASAPPRWEIWWPRGTRRSGEFLITPK